LLEELEEVSLLIPALKAQTLGWKHLASHPFEFHSLAESQSPDTIRTLIDLGFLKLNFQMLDLIEMTLDPERQAGSKISYRSLSQLAVPGFERLVMRDPSSFVRELLSQEGMLPESSDTLTWLLNSLKGHEELMFELLDRTDTIFDAVSSVPEVLWPNILNSDSVLPSKDVVDTCFEYFYYVNGEYVPAQASTDPEIEVENTAALLSFITRHADVLKSVLWAGEDAQSDLQKALLADARMSDVSVRTIFSETVLDDFSVLLVPLKASRWTTIATMDYLPYHKEVLAHITEKAPACIAAYLTKRWGEAAADFDPLTVDVDVLIGVTKSEAVTIREKVDLWTGINADLVKEHANARAEIARICEIGNRTNLTFPASTCLNMLWYVSTDVSISAKQRIEAFLQIVATDGVGWTHTAQFLARLDEEGLQRLAKGDRRFTVLHSDANLRLIGALRTKGFVGKATEKKDRITVNVLTSALKS